MHHFSRLSVVVCCVLALLVLSTGPFSIASDPVEATTLAQTPPMGWNSWNKFACDVSEKHIKEMADAMVYSGMQAAGFKFVNIDDCWQVSRDAQGII
jgi:alpha-galactosidase